HRDPARGYATEEVVEIVRAAGFDGFELRQATVPYLASPASRNARHEELVTMCGVRDAGAAVAPAPHAVLPPWLEHGDRPVPASAEISSRVLAMRIHAFVASLIDGQRSLRDIADVLVRERLMTADEAEPAVRAFLQRLHDETSAPVRP
ncbi:MAG TPA: PqqD family protein, partial [Steroidobacteraceae bacterium]